jgi:hypothetical protein
MPKHRHITTGTFTTLAVALLLTGCAANQFGPVERITIDSDPQGAKVYVADKEIGVTPLAVVLDDIFPKHWTSRTKQDKVEGFAFYRRLDTLALKKDGCEPYEAQVTTETLSADIKVSLKCDPDYKPPVAAVPAAPGTSAVEQRLQQLDALKQKGLVTDEEYRAQRQRILNQL